MDDRVEELYSYIQSRCLWQFFPREWDRRANIEGILEKAIELLTEGECQVSETLLDRYFYVEAKALVIDVKSRFPWLNELNKAEKRAIMEEVKKKLMEVMVVKSLNPELRLSGY
ncbi:MAG: protein VnfG [Archaeoglobus sp.]|nr:MAG: protein VnfG [Archaeoglobus sp.]